MEDWKTDNLENLLDKIIDYRGKTPTKTTQGIPLVTAKIIKDGFLLPFDEYIAEEDFDEWMVRGIPLSGDVVMTTEAPLGEVASLDERKIALAQRVLTLRGKQGILDNGYLKYFLKSKEGQTRLHQRATGSTVSGIKQSELKKVEITFPDYSLQRRIASVLSSLDAKIETNRRICRALEEMAQGIFKEWFVDFAPFKDGEFVEDEFGRRPKGWEVVSLLDVVDNIGGYSYKGNELVESTTAMVTIKNFERTGGFKANGYKEIVVASKCKKEQHTQLFDVLVAHTDLTQNAEIIGNPALILSKGRYEDLVFSMDLTKVVAKDERLSNFILYNILKQTSFKNHVLGYVNGTTVLHMSKKAVPEYKTYLPSDLDILIPLTQLLKPIYLEISNRMEQNINLASLRDTLLPKMMRGEIVPRQV